MPISKSPSWTTGGKIREWRQNAPPFCRHPADAIADRETTSDRERRQNHCILHHKNVICAAWPQYRSAPQFARDAFETLRTYVDAPCHLRKDKAKVVGRARRLRKYMGNCSDTAFVLSRASLNPQSEIPDPKSRASTFGIESPTTSAPSCSRSPSGSPRGPARCASLRRRACGQRAKMALR